MKFALIEATLILAGLVRRLKLDLTPDDDGSELQVSNIVTMRSDKPIRIVVSERM